jgi:hypothetical protein
LGKQAQLSVHVLLDLQVPPQGLGFAYALLKWAYRRLLPHTSAETTTSRLRLFMSTSSGYSGAKYVAVRHTPQLPPPGVRDVTRLFLVTLAANQVHGESPNQHDAVA